MSKGQIYLGIILTAGFIGLTLLFFFIPDQVPERLDKPFMLVVGSWVTHMTTIIQYFYGSSKGSADKTELLKK